MSEYMLHSNFGKTLTRVSCGNVGAYTFIWRLPYFLIICLPFWMFYQRKENLNKIKILQNFRKQTQVFDKPLEWFCSSSVSEVVLNAAAKSSGFNVRVIKNKKNKKNFKQCTGC